MWRRNEAVPQSVAAARQLSSRGLSAMQRNQWNDAETLLAQAVKTCPVDTEARRQYAEALWHRGATNEALSQLDEAIKLAADDATLYVRAGEMSQAMQRPEMAMKFAEQALDLDPKLASGWALRARITENTPAARQSLADYHRALGQKRDDPQLLLSTAELYRRMGQPQQALMTLQTLLDTYTPGEEPQQVVYLEGLAYAALERHEDAVDSFALAAQRGPPSAEILSRLAAEQLACGRTLEADRSVQHALALEPSHGPSLALRDRLAVAARPDTAAIRR
jgi:tetratricopeptide (TPR) repeat protein